MADGGWIRTVASLLDLWLWRLTAGVWRLRLALPLSRYWREPSCTIPGLDQANSLQGQVGSE
jgi:hypothetical protein